MKLFIPETTTANTAATYNALLDSVKSQLRWPVAARHIYSLDYVHDKKRCRVAVGERAGQGNRFVVLAIFESTCYIICTKPIAGGAPVVILVNKDEVTEVEEFQAAPAAA